MTAKKNLLEWAYHWEKNEPHHIFFTQPMGGGDANLKHWTVGQAMDEARRMARYIKSLDLPERSQIAICSKNCAYWILADLAIWMAGHVSVPVYPTLTPDTVNHILTHSESKLLFVGKLDPVWDEMKKGVPEGLKQIDFPLSPPNDHKKWTEIIANHEPLEEVVDRDPEEMATIIYTSGSTGVPKGVMVSFKAMLACTIGLERVLHYTKEDRYLSYLPISHGMERWLAECVALYSAEHLFFAESLDTFVKDLQRARPTLFLSVPRLWLKFQLGVFEKMPPKKLETLLKIPILSGIVRKKIRKALGLDVVRFAGSGSAPLPGELAHWYRSLGLELLEGYGMTENFNYSHITRPGHARVGYIGTPYDEVEHRLADGGEVQVKGPGTMMGYFKMPEETKAAFTEDGWLRTGDRGEIDNENRLKLTGRTKEIFKTSKGKYVSPAPIENLLVNHHRIEQCCVGGAGHPQPYAVVQLSEQARELADNGEQEIITRELEAHIKAVNAEFPNYEQLQFIAVVKEAWAPENGFLTPTMKIRRNQIEAAYGQLSEDWYASKKTVIWQE